MGHIFRACETAAALADQLADRVAGALRLAIETRGRAVIAVSGGTTPKAFFAALSQRDIAWDKVTVTLVDERFVPADHERSNHRLVREALLQNRATAASFVPLYYPAATAEDAARIASSALSARDLPMDVVVLGMGNDGHTASFFPGGNRLQTALSPATAPGIIAMEAEGAGEPRLTFTMSALDDARLLILHIEGASKKEVLDKALAGSDEAVMPIRAMLNRARSTLEIFWAP